MKPAKSLTSLLTQKAGGLLFSWMEKSMSLLLINLNNVSRYVLNSQRFLNTLPAG